MTRNRGVYAWGLSRRVLRLEKRRRRYVTNQYH